MGVLRIVMKEALFRELTDVDPFLGVGSVSYEVRRRGVLSQDALRLLLERARWSDELFWLASCTAAMTGLRAGEVRALQWDDLVPPVILVRRALSGEATVPDLPKWGKVRTCPYPATLQALLEPRRGNPEAWVFLRGKGALGYKRWAESLRAAAESAGLQDVTLHVLRHSLNTWLRGQGHADELIRGAFGWSSPEIQDQYTHREKYDYAGLSLAIDHLLEGLGYGKE
jgi:integrase